MRQRVAAALLLVLTMAAAVAPAATGPGAAAATGEEAPCPGFTDVPFQGPSCPVPGGWEVILRDGTRLVTHGPDPLAPEDHATDARLATAPAAYPPVCVPRGSTDEPHHLLIYAVPFDRVDRYDALAPSLRTLINESNGRLRAEGALFHASTNFPFACDADGLVTVEHAVLPTLSHFSKFSTIVSDLIDLGYGQHNVKHWVWYDGTMGGIGGQGHFMPDDRLSSSNRNNDGGQFGITYGHLSTRIMLHENGHNMGAVQNSAPHSSGGAHCNDGQDVMCYADGGWKSAYSGSVCADWEPYDCNHDDYFHPSPPSGSYLATHWNLGSTLNRFLSFENRPPLAPAPVCHPTPARVDQLVECRFTLDDESPTVTLDIDWGDGTTARLGPLDTKDGAARVTHTWGALGNYLLRATVTDTADPPLTSAPGAFTVNVWCGFERAATAIVGLQGLALSPWSVRTEHGVPDACIGRPYVVERSAASEWRVCWLDAAGQELACHDGHAGVVPEGAAAARMILLQGAVSAYFLKVQ